MADAYADRSYGSDPVGFGQTLGIIVVDFQKAFTRPGGALAGSPHIEAAVEATQRLLTHARAAGVRVAVSYVAYATLDAMPHWKVRAVKTDLFRGMPGTELDPRITAGGQSDYAFDKWGASSFFQTPLAAYFTRHGVDTVAVCGCTTSGCVRATVVDAFQFGFRTLLVADGCGGAEMRPRCGRYRAVIAATEGASLHSEPVARRQV
ncbi:hypothetical protein EMIHUDRAFT_457374 [Emiliania huxleyi CCMP1516]|uniref:Isochorismatase-like domain-containing protein n=2 Tax=Emiliania huxleyi TaxID=2903 RepID=A0A0D3JRW8_EMIH1|nr:hypothetical protein EMIHUDRAFT_457374 [Emiliania huxleyi CCMP1516]EOD26253.1 hypothetical protein EMIHUDRAFT_457374 [Emiliania huxleyi CCMP1516]|eukprot:XP_005778682.1 hypothetical protein EMIHUDRAFT_457374 [Emiliania huxleyi CCMP1516]